MPDLQTGDMRHIYGEWCQRSLWRHLDLTSCG